MTTIRIASFLVTAILAAGADDAQEIRSVLRHFNEAARKPEPRSFRMLFAAEADYRDGVRALQGSDALTSWFTNRQVWSERTPPTLEEASIRVVGPSAALVDAQLVQYGSTVVKSSVAVALVLKKEGDAWKIASWRTLSCDIPLSPR